MGSRVPYRLSGATVLLALAAGAGAARANLAALHIWGTLGSAAGQFKIFSNTMPCPRFIPITLHPDHTHGKCRARSVNVMSVNSH